MKELTEAAALLFFVLAMYLVAEIGAIAGF